MYSLNHCGFDQFHISIWAFMVQVCMVCTLHYGTEQSVLVFILYHWVLHIQSLVACFLLNLKNPLKHFLQDISSSNNCALILSISKGLCFISERELCWVQHFGMNSFSLVLWLNHRNLALLVRGLWKMLLLDLLNVHICDKFISMISDLLYIFAISWL